VAVLRIPRISADVVVVEGVDEPQLALGPGHYPGTPFPGEAGNAAIAGHRTTYGHPFYNLDQLQPGDSIEATTVQGSFSYRVVRSLVVNPSDGAVLDPSATPELTLTTCNPRYSASQRLVVQAVLTGVTPAAPSTPPTTTDVPSTTPGGLGTASGRSTGHLAGGRGGNLRASLWGGAVLIVLALTWWGVRMLRPRRRPWPAYGLGGVAFLAVLFGFFGAVTPLLPASF
jgi:sortase A